MLKQVNDKNIINNKSINDKTTYEGIKSHSLVSQFGLHQLTLHKK